jgi:hypothetical protein
VQPLEIHDNLRTFRDVDITLIHLKRLISVKGWGITVRSESMVGEYAIFENKLV